MKPKYVLLGFLTILYFKVPPNRVSPKPFIS